MLRVLLIICSLFAVEQSSVYGSSVPASDRLTTLNATARTALQELEKTRNEELEEELLNRQEPKKLLRAQKTLTSKNQKLKKLQEKLENLNLKLQKKDPAERDLLREDINYLGECIMEATVDVEEAEKDFREVEEEVQDEVSDNERRVQKLTAKKIIGFLNTQIKNVDLNSTLTQSEKVLPHAKRLQESLVNITEAAKAQTRNLTEELNRSAPTKFLLDRARLDEVRENQGQLKNDLEKLRAEIVERQSKIDSVEKLINQIAVLKRSANTREELAKEKGMYGLEELEDWKKWEGACISILETMPEVKKLINILELA